MFTVLGSRSDNEDMESLDTVLILSMSLGPMPSYCRADLTAFTDVCSEKTPMLSGPLFSNPMSTNQSIAIEIGRGLAKIANPLPIRMN